VGFGGAKTIARVHRNVLIYHG